MALLKETNTKTKTIIKTALMIVLALTLAACLDSGDDDPNSDDPNSGNSGGGKVPGNTQENAIPVTVGYLSSHTINSSGQHWFKFAGTGEPVIFETRGTVVDTWMRVEENIYWPGEGYDDNSGAGSNALCSFNSTLGTTYFIRIEPRSGTSGTYTFVVTAPTFNIRTNPIPITAGYSSSHTINSSGTHWFRFQGTGSSAVFETDSDVVNTSMRFFVGDNTDHILTDNKRISFSTVSGTAYYISITGNNGTYTFSVRNGTGDGSSMTYAIPVTVGYSSSHTISRDGEHWFSFLGTGDSVIFETEDNVVDTWMRVEGHIYWPGEGYDDNSGDGYNAKCSFNTVSGTTYFIRIETRSGTSGTYTFVVR